MSKSEPLRRTTVEIEDRLLYELRIFAAFHRCTQKALWNVLAAQLMKFDDETRERIANEAWEWQRTH